MGVMIIAKTFRDSGSVRSSNHSVVHFEPSHKKSMLFDVQFLARPMEIGNTVRIKDPKTRSNSPLHQEYPRPLIQPWNLISAEHIASKPPIAPLNGAAR